MAELSLAAQVLDAARRRGIKIATAESCTGGLVSAALTEIAGSSDVFDRGFVTYSNEAKMEMLGVSAKTLTRFGAVSEQVAQEMVAGSLNNSQASLSISITGIAGPGGSEHKPEGRVCFGVASSSTSVTCETIEFGPLGRDQVRAKATIHALQLLQRALHIG